MVRRLLVMLLLLALHLHLFWYVLILPFFSLHDTWIFFTITGLLSRNNYLVLLCLAMCLLIYWHDRPRLQHLCRGLVERRLFNTVDDWATLLLCRATKFLPFFIAQCTTPFLWLRWNHFWCNMRSCRRMSRLWRIYNRVIVCLSTKLRWRYHCRDPTRCDCLTFVLASHSKICITLVWILARRWWRMGTLLDNCYTRLCRWCSRRHLVFMAILAIAIAVFVLCICLFCNKDCSRWPVNHTVSVQILYLWIIT